MRRYAATALALVVSGSAAFVRDAAADSWPINRHDAGRTGASSGSVPLASGSIAWRTFLGSSPDADTVHFGMSSPGSLVSSSGGRFVARDASTQAVFWSSEILGTGTVVGFADLYGDGKNDVVVQTGSQAHVLDPDTGAVRWSSPLAQMQIMGAVRIRDMDGDGHPDLYLDNGIGAKPATTLASVFAFSTGAAVELWSLPLTLSPQSLNSGTDSLVDLDEDGIPEVVLPSSDSILVVRGSDGTVVSTLPAPGGTGHAFPQSSALSAELDGQPGLELLTVQANSFVGGQVSPNVAAYRLDPSTGVASLLWSDHSLGYDAELSINGDVTTDLDGDGIAEVIFSARSGSSWSTQVRDGATGNVIASLPNTRFEGAATLDATPGSELVVATTSGLATYRLSGGALQQLGALLPGVRALHASDDSLRASSTIQTRLAVVPGPGEIPMLLVGSPDGSPAPFDRVGTFTSVQGFQLSGSAFVSAGTYAPTSGVVTGAIRADLATRPYAQFALGTSEGLVAVLNRHLQPTNGAVWSSGQPVGAFVGGTHLAAPVLSSQDFVGPFVVFPESSSGTLAADVRGASWVVPPATRWSSHMMHNPSVLDVNGIESVVGVEGQSIVARQSHNGSAVSTIAMPAGHIWGSPLPMHIAGSTSTRAGIDWRVDGIQIAQTQVNFASNSVVWSAAPIAFGGFYGSSIGDVDGDGTDEWYTLESTLYRRDASTGSFTTQGSFAQMGYSLPVIASFQSGSPQILLQAGGQGPTLVAGDASVLWSASSTQAVNGMAGAKTECASAPRFVTPAVQSSVLQAYEGQTGNLAGSRSFAGGQTFATEQAAIDAGKRPGMLSHVTAVADLDGAPAVLAGSSDGYLYVVDPCTLGIRWTAYLGASVGEPVVADVDGDGDDEIVVTAADGYVYGFDTLAYEAPLVAVDGDDGSDVLSVAPGSSMALSWQAVEGASSYEVALLGPDDKPLNDPAYHSVDGTSASVPLDGALAGRAYRVSVRAKGSEGSGKEALSKKVIVADSTPPSAQVTFAGGASASLTIGASDDVALDHYEVVLHSGDEVSFLDDALFTGKSDSKLSVWKPEGAIWGSDVTLDVTVYDSAGLKSASSISAHVDENGNVTASGPGSEILDETPIPTDGPSFSNRPSESAGSGCSTGGSGSDASALFALGVVGLAAARRRRSRS